MRRLFGNRFFAQEMVEIIDVPIEKEATPAPISDTLIMRIEIKNVRQKSGHTISAYNRYGELLFESPCSAGKGRTTPIGTFKFIKQKPKLYSFNLQLYANWPSYFGKHLAIHGWPVVIKTGKSYQANRLGGPASIGCIRVPDEFAKKIYDNISFESTKLIISA